MRQAIVKDRQSLIDLAVQHYGSAAAVIDLCLDNNLELDDELIAGTVIKLRDDYPESADTDFAEYIKQSGIVVVSMNPTELAYALGTNNSEYITTNDSDYISAQ